MVTNMKYVIPNKYLRLFQFHSGEEKDSNGKLKRTVDSNTFVGGVGLKTMYYLNF